MIGEVTPSYTMLFSLSQIARHALLHPVLTDTEIHDGLKKSRVAAVCGKQYSVTEAKKMFAGSDVLVCATVGHPPREQHNIHQGPGS